jgi:hypothetical protein
LEAIEQNKRRNDPEATAAIRKENPNHYKGVKGLWTLDILPYAALIHWTTDMMHTFNNVIRDSLNSLRPSYSGNDSGLYYKHINRTYTDNVAQQCLQEDIFSSVFSTSNAIPPWVLRKQQCLDVDESMKRVLGAHTSEEVPPFIMRGGGAKKSHDTIHWAHTFSAWCFSTMPGAYIQNICSIFSVLALCNAPSHLMEEFADGSHMKDYLVQTLCKRSGCVPPSECCVTLHELMHVFEQISEIGPNRRSNLFKFEKMNKEMKSYVKNQAKGDIYG